MSKHYSRCIFVRRKDGRWECARSRCRYITKKKTYEKAPIRDHCIGGGPGTALTRSLAFFGITEEWWIRQKVRLGLKPGCGCGKRAQQMDELFWKSPVPVLARAFIANYRGNVGRWFSGVRRHI